MKVLIVFAHPEPDSFGGAMLGEAVGALRAYGHEVRVSDLYRMDFNPVASAGDFQHRRFPDRLQYDREQKLASQTDGFAPDIRAELDKLLWCDHLIFQFPLWWFSVPAILKGWIDRVLVNGLVYGQGRRLDTGGLKGRRAMLAFSTGCFEDMMAPDGLLGGLDIVLWHLHAGTFRYCGLEVLPPFVAWHTTFVDDARRRHYLDEYRQRVKTLDTAEPLFFHPQSDFENHRLKPDVEPRSPGLRRTGR